MTGQFSQDDRRSALSNVGTRASRPAHVQAAPCETKEMVKLEKADFYIGDVDWPISPTWVEAFAGTPTGLATSGAAYRRKCLSALVCTGQGQVIPRAEKFLTRLSCNEVSV